VSVSVSVSACLLCVCVSDVCLCVSVSLCLCVAWETIRLSGLPAERVGRRFQNAASKLVLCGLGGPMEGRL
jgi:hypothetical protein